MDKRSFVWGLVLGSLAMILGFYAGFATITIFAGGG